MDPIILRIEPELDERAATATMTRAQRVYEQGSRDISKVMRQQLTQGTEAAGRGFDELETKARKAYLGMQDASEKVASAERKHQAAVEKGAASAESLGRKVERARLAEIEAIEKATAAYKEYGQAADRAGHSAVGGLRGALSGMRSAGGEAASGFMEGFTGSSALMSLGSKAGPIGLAVAGVAAIGVVSGKVLADNIAAGMDQLRMRDLVQTRLGVDSSTMQTIGDAAGAAYVKGFGGSVEDNLKTISAGIRAGLISPKSSDSDLAKFTERMDTTSKITGQDTGEIASKSRNIVRSGLAADYKEVLDLLNSAAGKQLDISGDLLDTLEEYSTAWHGVGLSAQDAVGLMKQMSDAGIRNTDVAADSLKELSINVSDNSKTTRQALRVLGFDADEMNRKFAQGGTSARDALSAVLTALQDLKDPVDKQNVGLALFKTKWEDNKTAIEAANLKTAASDMGKVAGATDEATPKLNEHADAWTNLGNKISEMWDKTERKLADGWLGKFVDKTLPGMLSQGFDLALNLGTGGAQLLGMDPLGLHDKPPRFAGGGGSFDPAGPPPGHGWFPGLKPPDAPGLGHGAQSLHWDDAAEADKASKTLPPAPVVALNYTSTAGLPSGIANAQQSLDERKHDVAEKEARLHQLEQTNIATADDIQKAKNDLTKAQQDQLKAEQSLNDARVNATKQANKQLSGLSSDLNDLGSQLDKDFGISKGLGGIVENAVKALGNVLAAPFLQALGFVAKANPNEGSGLVGIAAANGMFGQQYTPGAIAAASQTTAALDGLTTAATSAAGALTGGSGGGLPYGLPTGTNTGGYGSSGAAFPSWVHDLEQAFGVKASTYAGHQESDRHEPGYAPNPMHQNRGIDWTGSPQAMQAFANYMASQPNAEQVIYQNPLTGQATESVAGQARPGYFASDLGAHQNHVHTRQAYGIGTPGLNPLGGPAGVPPASGGAPLHPGVGPANAIPGVAPLGQVSPAVGGGVPYPTTGGNSGNVLGGLPMDGLMAAAGAADLMMPGAGAAAKIGIQVGNRTVGYVAQNMGIAANAVGEFLSVGDNPKGSLGAGWLGKLAGGIAGAAPALPNLAGGKKPPGPMEQPGGGQQQGNTDNSQTNNITVTPPPGTSANTQAAMVAEQGRMREIPGRQ
ncbi:phage tail tape measure protein [Mycobacterium sp. PDNC021]|uniref:phage tail tape measure protein n=1 Tax=Mycobacterium sp. PDNC021 TaxID=3391399 RepID=UPI003AAC0B4F